MSWRTRSAIALAGEGCGPTASTLWEIPAPGPNQGLKVRNYLSWLVAFVCVAAALVVLGAPLRSWAAFVGIAVVIVVGLVLQAIARRRRTR